MLLVTVVVTVMVFLVLGVFMMFMVVRVVFVVVLGFSFFILSSIFPYVKCDLKLGWTVGATTLRIVTLSITTLSISDSQQKRQ
jgi:hypothetical protein